MPRSKRGSKGLKSTALQEQIESLERVRLDNLVRPSQECVASKVAKLKKSLTEKSAVILRKILGTVTLTPTTNDEGRKFYIASIKIGTTALLGSSDDGWDLFVKWRWGETMKLSDRLLTLL